MGVVAKDFIGFIAALPSPDVPSSQGVNQKIAIRLTACIDMC